MKLTILDRLLVQSILPGAGDIVTIKIVRDLSQSLGFSEDEIKQHNIVQGDGQVRWDSDTEKDVEIGPKALAIIVSELERLNKEKKLTVAHLPVYEKFVGE